MRYVGAGGGAARTRDERRACVTLRKDSKGLPIQEKSCNCIVKVGGRTRVASQHIYGCSTDPYLSGPLSDEGSSGIPHLGLYAHLVAAPFAACNHNGREGELAHRPPIVNDPHHTGGRGGHR